MTFKSFVTSNFLAVIAIVISFFAITITITRDFFLPFIFKPRVNVRGIDDGECIEDAKSPSGIHSRWVRLRIKNKDSFFSRPSKNCYVKLLEIINNKNNKKVTPFNPLPLTWVHYDNEYQGGKHDLSVGEYHLIDLVHEKSHINNRILCFKISLPIELKKNLQKELGPGSYTFTVGIYGDNFKSQRKEFKIKFPKEYGGINFV